MKPVIGITTLIENKPRKPYSSISYNYVNSVYLAGGVPMLIPVIPGENSVDRYIDVIDGLLLSGGEDISPLLYGEDPIKEVVLVSEDRDYQEYNLFFEALKRDMPVLGICRGIQLMNTASKGTLYQDIHVQKENAIGHSPSETPVNNLYHTVKIEKGSKLFEIFKTGELKVNSFHHQAVKDIGKNLKATAFSNDGIIEGLESLDKTFVVGVQWHPEDLTAKYHMFLELFKVFIDECTKYLCRK